MNQNLDDIGRTADRIDSLVAALSISVLPAATHVEMLRVCLPEISQQIKQAVIAETGEDPWEMTEDS